jgi:hypothetical protein
VFLSCKVFSLPEVLRSVAGLFSSVMVSIRTYYVPGRCELEKVRLRISPENAM